MSRSRKLLFLLSLVLVVWTLGVIACYLSQETILSPAPAPTVRSNHPSLQYDGIDVSHHQGELDWEQLAKDPQIQFVYIKATEGANWKDKQLSRNRSEARKYGIKIGAYHVLNLKSSPEKQVENFCSVVRRKDIDLIPAIDIEARLLKVDSKKLLKYAIRVDQLLTERFGRKPLIYSSESVFNDCLFQAFQDHYLWIALYQKRYPSLKGGTKANIWQFSENDRTTGYPIVVDLNRFIHGMTLEKLEMPSL